jgi:hypothetical protein
MNRLSTVKTKGEGSFRDGRCDEDGFQQVQIVGGGGAGSTETAIDQSTPGTTNKVTLGADVVHTIVDSGSVTSITNALPAGTNLLGKVGIDQTTPGTTNAVYPLETSDVLDLVLSTDTVQYASGDVLAATQELTGVTRVNAGTARLESLKITDADDQGQSLDVIFLKTNVSIGTENAAVSIADADAIEILGIIQVLSSDFLDLGGVRVATVPIDRTIMLKSGAASTSIYVAAISRGTGTYSASGLSMKIGILRL